MFVLFWTDASIFLLLSVVVAFALYARRKEHLRAPWRGVARSRMGLASAVVLGAFVLTGLLDSVHFHPLLEPQSQAASRYSSEVLSLFDRLAMPLRERVEKTYSAPFATHLYAKETMTLPDGRQVRDYPRLQFGGAHLKHPARDRGTDIARTIASATVEALILWGLLIVGIVWLIARQSKARWRECVIDIARQRTIVPWHVMLLTLGVNLWGAVVVSRLCLDYHILGTDKVGQDVFYQTLKSIRTGLLMGTLTTLVMLPFAILLGIAAGYFGSWVDDVIQYLYTTLNSVPGVLLIAAAILMLQVYMATHAEGFESLEERADLRLLFLCIILGVRSWTGLCRVLRGETLKLRELDYIQAARAFGVGHFTIILRHILPNVLHLVLIAMVLDFSELVLAEAVLSYLNIGVDPSMNSWGNMINGARLEMAREPMVWWSLAAAFLFMFTLVLSANIFSDAVRDAFDPRLRELQRE